MMILSKNASRHRHRFAQQRLGFFEAPYLKKTIRVDEQLDWTNGDIPDDILEGLEGILKISRA